MYVYIFFFFFGTDKWMTMNKLIMMNNACITLTEKSPQAVVYKWEMSK